MSNSTKESFNSRQGQHFSLLKTSSPALRPTQPSSQCVLRHFTEGASFNRGVTLVTHRHLVCITSPFTFKYCINIGHCGISVGTEHCPVVGTFSFFFLFLSFFLSFFLEERKKIILKLGCT